MEPHDDRTRGTIRSSDLDRAASPTARGDSVAGRWRQAGSRYGAEAGGHFEPVAERSRRGLAADRTTPAEVDSGPSARTVDDMSNADELAAVIEHASTDAWLGRAACAELELDQLPMFFVDAGRSLSSEAAALCERCQVRRECLDHAVRLVITSGYFGGQSPAARRRRDGENIRRPTR